MPSANRSKSFIAVTTLAGALAAAGCTATGNGPTPTAGMQQGTDQPKVAPDIGAGGTGTAGTGTGATSSGGGTASGTGSR